MRISDWSSDVCSSDLPISAHKRRNRRDRSTGDKASPALALDDFHHVRKLADHAAHFRGVDQFDLAVHLAQAEAGQDRTLALGTTDRRTDLADLDLLVGHRLTPSPPRLRPRLRGRSATRLNSSH